MAGSIRSCLMSGHDFSVRPLDQLLMDTLLITVLRLLRRLQGVVVFVLPPSTTHCCTQLLDKDAFLCNVRPFAFGRNEVLMIWLRYSDV